MLNHASAPSRDGFRRWLSAQAARTIILMVTGLLLTVLPVRHTFATTMPTGFSETTFVSGFQGATGMAVLPDGRFLVTQQGGALRVVENGVLLPTPAIQITVDSFNERGLLGVVPDPNFATNGFIYLYYTVPGTTGNPTHNRISRFTMTGNTLNPASEFPLMDLDPVGSSSGSHNAGDMHFGLDGKLYVATGDAALNTNAQTLNNRLGKILRLNNDGSIPNDNPFYNTAAGPNRSIYVYGLRNPFRFAIDPLTGRMHINDVGQFTWEEINLGSPGANYGWPATEGPTTDPRFVAPIYAYPHSAGPISGCAITAGVFYRPETPNFPASYEGDYFFQEYCQLWIGHYDVSTGTVTKFATGTSVNVVDMDMGPGGALYYLSRGGAGGVGSIQRISYSAAQTFNGAVTGFTLMNADTDQPVPGFDPIPNNAQINVGQIGTTNLNIRANTNPNPVGSVRFDLNGGIFRTESGAPYALAGDTAGNYAPWPYTLNTPYTLTGTPFSASNASGAVGVPLTINFTIVSGPVNQAPVVNILTPVVGTIYKGGDVVSFSAEATDAEDGVLPPSAYQWEVLFHHDDHTHPHVLPFTGATSGTFNVPTVGETSTNVWFRIYLRVTDSQGRRTEVTRDVLPEVTTVTLQTNPPGLTVLLDGIPHVAPFTSEGVASTVRSIGVLSPQTLNGVSYTFANWSDNGAAEHNINWPVADGVTFVATFNANGPVPTATPTATPNGGGPTVTSLTLIDAVTNMPVPGFETLTDGAVVNLAALPGVTQLSLRANTNPFLVGSVRFGVNANANFRTENGAPYSINGDIVGDFLPWPFVLNTPYTVTATAFSAANGAGTASAPLTVTFTITNAAGTPVPTNTPSPTPLPTNTPMPSATPGAGGPSVTSLTLIDSVTNLPVPGFETLTDGAIINLATLPGVTQLTVRANTNPAVIGSVRFVLNGVQFRVENGAPYALNGDFVGDFLPWLYTLNTTYTLTAVPFSGANLTGTQGTAVTVNFTIINSSAGNSLVPPDGAGEGGVSGAPAVPEAPKPEEAAGS